MPVLTPTLADDLWSAYCDATSAASEAHRAYLTACRRLERKRRIGSTLAPVFERRVDRLREACKAAQADADRALEVYRAAKPVPQRSFFSYDAGDGSIEDAIGSFTAFIDAAELGGEG